MKTFKNRVETLLEATTNPIVRAECTRILEMSVFTPDKPLRDILINILEKMDVLEVPEKVFIGTEKRLTLLEDMGLKDAFKDIFEVETVFQENPKLGYVLNPLRMAFEARTAPPVVIAENLIDTLMPYNFNPIVEKHITRIKGIFEQYEVDIVLTNIMNKISRIKTGDFYTKIVEKIGDYVVNKESSTISKILAEMTNYQYEPAIREAITVLSKYDSSSSLHITNENSNYRTNVINAFVWFDEENTSERVFFNRGNYYSIKENEMKVLSENEVGNLPTTFKNISMYAAKPTVNITNETMKFIVGAAHIEYNVSTEGLHEAFLNGIKVSNDNPYQFFVQSGLFEKSYFSELAVIGKIWENLDLLVEMDFGKNIDSITYPGLSGTIYKLGESFYIQESNVTARHNRFRKNLNAVQAKNALLEFLKYDITESLYEYMEGPNADVAKLRNEQKVLENEISGINLQIIKLNKAMNDPLVAGDENVIATKANLEESIELRKGQYAELEHEIGTIQVEVNEDVGDGHYRPGANVRVKDSGQIGKIDSVNGPSKTMYIVTDDGDTLELGFDAIELIDDSIAQTADELQDKAKNAENIQ